MTLAVGEFSSTTIRRFHVAHLIARGGMGEVYHAKDALLGRDLALKVLRQDITKDPDRIARFIQEARAASALNHPHLIAIYDIGESAPKNDGVPVGPPVHYIAMELVAGQTLRAAIEQKSLTLDRTLEYLIQVAEALTAAHAAGVIHRDLKPENLMVADEGYAKVLDFGLAKLRGDIFQPGAPVETALTAGGMMLGTVGYMSPEQVQGRRLDHRTDIFSFGCVLYESVTGNRAFQGASPLATLKQIIKDDPTPLAQRRPMPSERLQAVVRKCLAKEPDQRYQSMRDVANDLREVRRELEVGRLDGVSGVVKRHPLLTAAAALLLVALGAWWTFARVGRDGSPPDVTIERLTASGTAIDAAVSPDGQFMAWVESAGGLQGLRVRPIGENRSTELVPPARVGYWGITFSRDGSDVLYATKSAEEPAGRLFAVSRLGGAPRPLLEWIDSTVAISADGRRMAFYRAGYPERGATALMIADIDGGNMHVLARTSPPEFFVPAFFAAPSWSPDGSQIAAAIHEGGTGGAQLVTIDVGSGAEQRFDERFEDVTFTAWLPDGSGIMFVANHVDGLREFPRKVWLQPYPRGEPRRVTPDLLEYRNISLPSDGLSFVSVGLDAVYTLWRLPLDSGVPQRIASERYDGLLGLAPLPDGRLIVTAGERGNSQLVLLEQDGADRQQLTSDGTNLWPAASPDGRTIAFVSNRDGQAGVWRMNVDGTGARLLTHLPTPSWLSITPDGRFVVCASLRDAETATWKIPIEGGEPVLIAAGLDRPAVSPDGRLVAGINVTAGASQLTLMVMPLNDSGEVKVLGTIAPATGNGLMEWTADGQGILFSTVERTNVWMQRLSGGPPVKVTNLTDLGIARGRRTPDGRSVIVTRGVAQTDAYLISNFR